MGVEINIGRSLDGDTAYMGSRIPCVFAESDQGQRSAVDRFFAVRHKTMGIDILIEVAEVGPE